MNDLDASKFRNEIKTFKALIAPSDRQWNYLNGKKNEFETVLHKTSKESGQTIERCLLVAICGELPINASQAQQAEFASRLILLDLLTEWFHPL